MSDEDYQALSLGLVCANNAYAITDAQEESARRALDRAVEFESMYEGLCD